MVKNVFSRAFCSNALFLIALLFSAIGNLSAQDEFGTAVIKDKHTIVLAETAPLKAVYAAEINIAAFGGASEASEFFNSRIKNNHVRFEIISEKSLLLIYLSNYSSSPQSVAEWNVYFEKKSSSLR